MENENKRCCRTHQQMRTSLSFPFQLDIFSYLQGRHKEEDIIALHPYPALTETKEFQMGTYRPQIKSLQRVCIVLRYSIILNGPFPSSFPLLNIQPDSFYNPQQFHQKNRIECEPHIQLQFCNLCFCLYCS